MAGTVTLVRTIWSTDPNHTTLPPLGCGATLSRMLLIDGESAEPIEHVPELRVTLEAATVGPADFQGAVNAIKVILDAFNLARGTSYVVNAACSLPNHVSTGAGGCRPGSGHTLLLNNSNPPKANLKTNYIAGPMIVSHGLVVSIKYPVP